MKHKKLTLIELIIVVMVLGLLVGLAIPQFTGVKANADVASFKNDIDVLTKAIDELYVKEDSLPLGDAVTVADPNLLDAIYASGDSGENLFKVDLAKTEKYHSKLKTPVTSENCFIYSSETGKVFYTKGQVDGEGQVLYSLEYTGLSSAMLGLNPLKNGVSVPVSEPVQTITGTVPVDATVNVSVNGIETPVTVEDVVFDGNMDLMAAVKMKTFTSSVTLAEGKNVVAIKVNSAVTNFNIYLGAQDSGGQPTPTPAIKPVAVISMTPEEVLTTATNIIWSYAGSTAAEGRTITAAEWEGNQNIYAIEGSYVVRLRVQDSTGVWSDWVEKSIEVLPSGVTIGDLFIMEVRENTPTANYYNTIGINELTVYDETGNKLPLTIVGVYDSIDNGTPNYWNNSQYGKDSLIDNDLSTCGFFLHRYFLGYDSRVREGDFARVSFKFTNPSDKNKVAKIVVNSHDQYGRGPRLISFFSTPTAVDLKTYNFSNSETIVTFDNGTAYVGARKVNTFILE